MLDMRPMRSLFGLCLLSFCWINQCLAGSQIAGGGYYCYVMCLAGQVANNQTQPLAALKTACGKYDRNEVCTANNTSCRKNCADLKTGTGSAPSTGPANLRANYTIDPEPDPYSVTVAWDRVSGAVLYILEYFEADSEGSTGKILGREDLTDTRAVISRDKKSLCVQYGFRVAAVNQNGVGPFSEDVILDKPVPIYKTQPTYKLKSLVFTNKEFRMVLDQPITDPNTVEATVEYQLPPNWKPSDFVSSNELVHTLVCKDKEVFTTKSNLSMDKAELVIPFPGSNVQSDCKYLYMLVGLNTICGTNVTFPDPSESREGNPGDIAIFVNINCANVMNSSCKSQNESKQASCGVRDFGFKVNAMSDKSASVTLTWGDVLSPRSWPVQYYIVKYSLSEKPKSTLVWVLPIVRNMGTLRTCSATGLCDARNRSATISNLELDKYFVAQICAVYDPSLDNSIPLDIVARYPIDLTSLDSANGEAILNAGTLSPSKLTKPIVTLPPASSSSLSPTSQTSETGNDTMNTAGNGSSGNQKRVDACFLFGVLAVVFTLVF